MGGDHGIQVVLPAALAAINKYSLLELILVGEQTILENALSSVDSQSRQRLRIQHASEVVAMDELPSQALRYKKDSSMRVAIDLVKERQAQAIVSAGNTGALMATSRFVLKMITGVDRPAIMGHIPSDNHKGQVRILDLGASIDSTTEQLLQFAAMGTIVASAVGGIRKPRIALLNIGEEEIKGNDCIKRAAELLSANAQLNYVGFAEGDDIFKDFADIIVCDGFVGNVALKTMEGAARLIAKVVKEEFTKNSATKIAALLSKPVLNAIAKRLDPAKYNGGSLLGVKGIVIKSHGGTAAKGFFAAIEHAIWETETNVVHLIETQLGRLLEQAQ